MWTWGRFNERKLKEARMEEETDLYRQRTGRLDKWREAARAALASHSDSQLPDSIQILGERVRFHIFGISEYFLFLFWIFFYHHLCFQCFSLRTGNVVLAMIPKKIDGSMKQALMVCYVTSIWISPRKPKLATNKVSMNYVVALRVLEMYPHEASKMWLADAVSTAWVLEPTAVAAILDVDHVLESENGLRIMLSSASCDLVNKKEELEKDWPKAGDGKKAAGLYITRPRKARKKGPKKQKVAESDKEADDQKEEPDKSKKHKGKKMKKTEENEENSKSDGEKDAKKSTKFLKLKKAKAPTETPDFAAANILKNGTGKSLIEDYMGKLKAKDEEAFPDSLLFSKENSSCKLNLPKVYGKEWSKIQTTAFEYFKQLPSS